MDEQFPKSALDKFRQWHFWWLVVFSLLLTLTFVYYLPTRFLNQTAVEEATHLSIDPGQIEEDHGHDNGEKMMGGEDMREHMGEHGLEGMEMDEMMEHMMEEHDKMFEDAENMMNEIMEHEHDEETDEHMMEEGKMMEDEHKENSYKAAYFEENNIKQGLAVNLNISPVPYNSGVSLSLDFFVNQKPGDIPVPADQLQAEHEKLMHVIGVRSDMNEFFHIHPEPLANNPSIFSISHIFRKPGSYKIWSEIKKDGVNYSFGHPEVNIGGSGLREEKNISFSRNIIAGNYQISLQTSDVLTKGQDVDFTFDIHTLTGQEVEVEEYLGAQMHLAVIKDDRSRFMHIHPELNGHSRLDIIPVALAHGGEEPAGATDEHQTSSSGDQVIVFHVNFPEAGLYKAFAQFRPKGVNLPADEALLAEFWILVEQKAPFPISQWWMLLLISAGLIAGLSWTVNRYLKVRPGYK